MPIARCIDCGQGRRYKRPPAEPRCKPCHRLHQLYLEKLLRDERRRKKLCAWCGEDLSAHSIFFCVACGSYHAGYQARLMREKRAKSPAYREDERKKVRLRMRAIREERRKAGLNTRGAPYQSATWQRKAADREGVSAS
jgi:predicted CXXCH cytochrome family protein